MSALATTRTTVRSQRARSIVFLGAVAILTLASCNELVDEALDSCGPDENINLLDLPNFPTAFASPDLTVTLNGSRRTFTWITVAENVCTHEHVNARWVLTLIAPGQFPPGFQVEAGWATSAAIGDDIILTASDQSGIRQYTGSADIGLKQVYGDGPGRFAMALSISFISQGNETADRQALQQAFNSFAVNFLAVRKAYKAP